MPNERAIVLTVGAVQFVNVLDFMMVMPLGQDFAHALAIPVSQLGYVGGAYTASACVSGIAGAFFLDRFDRRSALVVAMIGLFAGTLCGAFATGLGTIVGARLLAGAFGGPATSLAYSIIADAIPVERRGKAMGAVMGAFSIASVLGVPAGLELARRGGWRLPFIAVAALGGVVAIYAWLTLSPMKGHLANTRAHTIIGDFRALARFDVGLTLLLAFLTMGSAFVLLPNLSAFMIANLHYPRARLGLLYFVGGAVSFFAMRIVGRLVDRFGAARVGSVGVFAIVVVTYLGFARVPPAIPVMAMFVGYMVCSSIRNVAGNTLTTRVPRPDERARFGSVLSATQHFAAALGGVASVQLSSELPDGTLAGVPSTAHVSIALALAYVPLIWTIEHRLRAAA